jgi:hypothetical protein
LKDKNWIQTESDFESKISSNKFWANLGKQVHSGEFWAERIKGLKNEPLKRLKLALENLPLPASFRDAAIAIRALIREKRKAKTNYGEELSLLYWLAGINSFLIPYSEKLQEPGFNVIESMPGKIVQSIPFTYSELGYKYLDLLNKTDIKWITDAWGEPENHTTLHELQIEIWNKYEDRLKEKRDKKDRKFQEKLKKMLKPEKTEPKKIITDRKIDSINRKQLQDFSLNNDKKINEIWNKSEERLEEKEDKKERTLIDDKKINYKLILMIVVLIAIAAFALINKS